MKRVLASVSLIAISAVAGVRVYSVEPYKDFYGTATDKVEQNFTLTCDSVSSGDTVFISADYDCVLR